MWYRYLKHLSRPYHDYLQVTELPCFARGSLQLQLPAGNIVITHTKR